MHWGEAESDGSFNGFVLHQRRPNVISPFYWFELSFSHHRKPFRPSCAWSARVSVCKQWNEGMVCVCIHSDNRQFGEGCTRHKFMPWWVVENNVKRHEQGDRTWNMAERMWVFAQHIRTCIAWIALVSQWIRIQWTKRSLAKWRWVWCTHKNTRARRVWDSLCITDAEPTKYEHVRMHFVRE